MDRFAVAAFTYAAMGSDPASNLREKMRNEQAIRTLTAEWQTWCESNAMPLMSADELLAELLAETIPSSDWQRQFVFRFIRRWDAAERGWPMPEPIKIAMPLRD